MDWIKKVLRNRRALLVRVLWRNSQIEEERWEREYRLKRNTPIYSSISWDPPGIGETLPKFQ